MHNKCYLLFLTLSFMAWYHPYIDILLHFLISVKIVKNVGMTPVHTRRPCKVGLMHATIFRNPQKQVVGRSYRRLLRSLNPTLQGLLVATVFGTVSSLHATSFLMIFTLVLLIFPSHKLALDWSWYYGAQCICAAHAHRSAGPDYQRAYIYIEACVTFNIGLIMASH